MKENNYCHEEKQGSKKCKTQCEYCTELESDVKTNFTKDLKELLERYNANLSISNIGLGVSGEKKNVMVATLKTEIDGLEQFISINLSSDI